MKVTLDGDALYGAVSWVAKLLPARPAVSILAGILIEADDQLRLSAFDLETAGTVTAAGTVLEPGRVLVSGRLLTSVAKTVRGDHVDLVIEGRSLRVTAGMSTWSLPLMSAENYPSLPSVGDKLGELDGETLRTALARVLPAVARDGAVRWLTGAVMSAEDGRLTLAGTDKYRLAVAELEWPEKPFEQIIVPGELLTAVASLSDSRVMLHTNNFIFTAISGRRRITGRLLAEKYGPYQSLLGFEPSSIALLSRTSLLRAAERAGSVLGATDILRLSIDANGCEVTGTAKKDESSGRSTCPILSYEGDPLTVWVNPVYLSDALAGISTETVRLTAPARPVPPLLFQPADESSQPVRGYQHLVMSVKVVR